MKTIVVVVLNSPTPESVAESIQAIDPINVPHFAGEVVVAIGDNAEHVIDWLKG